MAETSRGIYYEVEGPDDGEPLVLVNGYTAQLVGWHPRLREMLAEAGHRVILLDNRDVGLSRKYGGEGDHDGGYTIDDMADDVISVLDDLGLESAHLAGQSMGGMIVQRYAINHPGRLRSMTLIYTTPHMRRFIGPTSAQADPGRLDRDAAIELTVQRGRVAASPGFPFDEARIREVAALAYDRCYAPDGWARQSTAVRTSFRDDQTEALRSVDAPALIIHGRDDPYFIAEASLALAEALPQSEVHIFAGMGHDLPPALFPFFVDSISRTVRRASGA